MGEGDTIIEKLEFIRDEKLNKIIPENIKSGVNILNVDGALSPSEDLDAELTAQEQKLAELEAMVENKTGGAGGKPNIFVQLEEPTKKDGIWLQVDETMEHIVCEDNIFISGEWLPDGATNPVEKMIFYNNLVTIGTDIYYQAGSNNDYKLYKYSTKTNTNSIVGILTYRVG